MDRTQRVGRRHFLRTGGRAMAGLTGFLAVWRAPAAWAARELSILTAVNYAPTSDVKLAELGKRFAKLAGASVRVDQMQCDQMSAKLSAQLMSLSGHDIISLEMHYPWLFAPGLVDVSDICTDLARKHGEWYSFAREHAYIRGQWLAVPYLFISFPGSHRIDLFEQVGEKPPDTWEDLLRAGQKLKKLGHPVGFAISQTTDSVSTLYSILWAYGARDVAEDGKTITINSKATEVVVDYVRALYNDAMDPAVLSWDNASNNQWLNSGKGSWIHNPISHYVVAKEKQMPVAKVTGFHSSPAGPGGRHTVGVPRSLAAWKFSKNVDLAKEFLRWFFEPAQYHEWIMSGANYNPPVWRDMENHAVWNIDPKSEPLKTIAQYSHLYGWPAPPDERIQLVTNSCILPNMFAKVVTNAAKPKEAILWAETEIKRGLDKGWARGDPALRPEPLRRPLGGRFRGRRAALRDVGLGRRLAARLAAPASRHLRAAGVRRANDRAHHARHAAGESDEPAPHRHRVVHRDDRRAGAGACRARLGHRRHRRPPGRAPPGAHQGARGEHAADAVAARRSGRGGRGGAARPAAASSARPDLDRRGRPAHAADGRRRGRRRFHPRGHASREHRTVHRRHPRGRRRGRTRSVEGSGRRRVPHRVRRRSGTRAGHGQVHGRRLLRVLADAVRRSGPGLDGAGSGAAQARSQGLARFPPRDGPGGQWPGRRFPAQGRRRCVLSARWPGGDHRAAPRRDPLGSGDVRSRGPPPGSQPDIPGRSRARLHGARRARDLARRALGARRPIHL